MSIRKCPPCIHPERCAIDQVCLEFLGHPAEPSKAVDEAHTPLRLIEELRAEAALVPHRRGELYKLAADEIEELRDAISSIVRASHRYANSPSTLQGYIGRAEHVLNKGK